MLFNPRIILTAPVALILTVLIVIAGKSVAAYLIVRAFGRNNRTAITISASLAQIGEFSFILATLGGRLGLLPPEGRDLILAAAIFSIMLNPLIFSLIDRLGAKADPGPAEQPRAQSGHIVLVGYGRVGRIVAAELIKAGKRLTIVDSEDERVDLTDGERVEIVIGNAASADTLRRAAIEDARLLFVTIPEGFEAGQVVEQARKLNPGLRIVARAWRDAEAGHLERLGADATVQGRREIARRMVSQALAGA